MATEDLDFHDDNEIDMDYLDMDSPEPEPRDVDDMKSEHTMAMANSNDVHRQMQSTQINSNKRGSYTNNQTQAILKQFQSSISELQSELRSASDENERLMVKNETLIIEYDAKIDELNLEIDELQIESQQYQIRYSEINEELHELRSSQADHVTSGKENKELLVRLRNKEQNEMSLMIDLEQSNKQNETIKKQLRSSTENITKLQKAIIQFKKEKTTLDKSLQSTIDKYQHLQRQTHLEISSLTDRVTQLDRENEIYRQNLSTAEAEKLEMQNTFTEATMELITSEFNEAHGDEENNNETSLRLGRVSSSDMNRRYNNDSVTSVDITMINAADADRNSGSHFIKQRFGSQTSLPDQNLLESYDEIGPYQHHSRKSSLDSRMGGYEVDPVRLKQDIREILIKDIKTLLTQELANINTSNSDTTTAPVFDPEIFRQFEENIKKKIENIIDSKDDMKEFENIINEKIKNIMDAINNLNNNMKLEKEKEAKEREEERQREEKEKEDKNSDDENNNDMADKMKEILCETIENQMSVFQISLENQIGNTVSENIKYAMQSVQSVQPMQSMDSENTNVQFTQDIKNEMTEYMNQIKQEIMNNNNNNNVANVYDEEALNNKLESAMNNIMNGKMDGFMAEFRKEVIPEFMAMFEQLNTNKNNYNNDSDYANYDDEKANSNRNELLLMNEKFKKEIQILKQEKENHDKILRNAATSKVHQVVKLQNLLDHMRNDNRILQFQLNKYKETFIKIKETQDNNVVNKFWGYFGQNNASSHLST